MTQPLSPKEITIITKTFSKKLEKTEVDEKQQKCEECPICFNLYDDNCLYTTLPGCAHNFHFDCIEKWIKISYSCPVCRGQIRKGMIEHFHGPFEIVEVERNDNVDGDQQDVEINEAHDHNLEVQLVDFAVNHNN